MAQSVAASTAAAGRAANASYDGALVDPRPFNGSLLRAYQARAGAGRGINSMNAESIIDLPSAIATIPGGIQSGNTAVGSGKVVLPHPSLVVSAAPPTLGWDAVSRLLVAARDSNPKMKI